jgi:phosphomevalonate kinase
MKFDFLAGSHMELPKTGIAAAVAVVASIVIYLALSWFFVRTEVSNMPLIATSINPVTDGKLAPGI